MLKPADIHLVKLQIYSTNRANPLSYGCEVDVDGIPVFTFTCDGCAVNDECEYAFEEYCRDGECLAEK